MSAGVFAFSLSGEIVVIGALTGLAYAILAAGIVLVYRATRVINFAHGEIGAFGAAALAKLVLDEGWSWFVAFPLVLAVGGAIGALIELTIIRRLFDRSRLVLLVATIGVAQIMFFAQAILPDIDAVARYPTGLERVRNVGGVLLRGEHFMVLAFVPAAIAGLTLFLNRTPYGMAIRASAENPEAARLAGVNVRRVSTIVWVLAAVLSTATFVLINPVRGTVIGQASAALGPTLLLRALAAALVGRLTSLPLALVGGIGIGIVEAVVFVNAGTPGLIDAALFVMVLLLVLVQGRELGGDAADSGFSLTGALRPVPERLRSIPWVRRLPLAVGAAGFGLAAVLPFVFTSSAQQFLFSRVVIFAIIGVSVVVLTGMAGQLSLGQFAFVGLGSLLTFSLVDRGMPLGAAMAYATVAGIMAALAIGGPALRVRGLSLAITTLAFAVAAHTYVFKHELLTSGETVVFVPRPTWGPFDFSDQRTYYYLCLLTLAATIGTVTALRRSGVGRMIIAVRDNEHAAAAFTVSPTFAKLTAFAVSGGIAALGGALLAGLRVQFSIDSFGPDESLRIVAMTIIGGLGSVAGAVLGAVYVLGLPALIEDSQEVRLLTSGIGLLILLLYLPGGLLQIVHKLRDLLLSRATPPTGDTTAIVVAPPLGDPLARITHRQPDAKDQQRPTLAVDGVRVSFGGLAAIDGVSIEAGANETVGLIGSNGAGKSTLMNVISGFQRVDGGSVRLHGDDITALPDFERSRLGIARLFQDARLFGSLTVRESIQVALEAREPSEVVPSLLSLPPARRAERRKRTEADELVGFLGLGRYADSPVASLSTGTRRIAELACLVALDSEVLLLDEPTAGVAQRETEAFGPLIERIRAELGATLVLIEHDMPLVMSLSDRIYCMSSGRVIASGPPAEIRNHPGVIAAYLGTDERAINRSDSLPTSAAPERVGVVTAGGGA